MAATPTTQLVEARELEFGIYRDGDNNLDTAQTAVLQQAVDVSAENPHIAFNVEDVTSRADGFDSRGDLHTEEYTILDGAPIDESTSRPKDMAQRKTLSDFVCKTLNQAEKNNSKATWIDLVDHGGGDGGAFQTGMSGGKIMTEDEIASAIADGIGQHARLHPEDEKRSIDGVVFNACLMATCGMESALSHVGVRFLAASPESMLAPGVPTTVASSIADHMSDPAAMAKAIVQETMTTKYGNRYENFSPAAAFDVFDLAPKKIAAMENAIRNLNDTISTAASDRGTKTALKADGRKIDGMARTEDPGTPWQADRPAIALFNTLANDTRLGKALRTAADAASTAVNNTVLAHGESNAFAPFNGTSYSDAAGPTVHFPVTQGQVDPWAPNVSETQTAFADKTHELQAARALLQSATAKTVLA